MKNLILSCMAILGLTALVGCSCDEHRTDTQTTASIDTDSKDMHPRHHADSQ